jgi:hypothetical protein
MLSIEKNEAMGILFKEIMRPRLMMIIIKCFDDKRMRPVILVLHATS